jgi:transposase
VNHDSDLRRRLDQLEQLLVQHEPWFRDNAGADGELVAARIHATLQRLRQFTTAMQRRTSDNDDPLDRVTMRLMLDDYAAVLSHLRASVRTAEQLLSSVEKTVTDGHRVVRREAKHRSR